MEGKKNKLIIVGLMFSVLMATAQTKDLSYYQCAFYESYRMGNMAPWPGLIDEMENAKSDDLQWQTEIVKALYGLVGYEIGAGRKDLAKNFVEKADKYLDKLLEKYPDNAQLHSLCGALYGYKISFAFYKAPFFGPKSLSHIEKSIELDPLEPMGYIERGNSLMYRPAAFGGDKYQALINYRKALKLKDSRNSQRCDWQKMLLRAFILKALYETKQDTAANAFLIEMQKDYGSMDWIKQFVGTELIDAK
jgi:tetratricopeptide (TPR) repeat protein